MSNETKAPQPAYDGGFTAADMMDARQEGRKEAQQPAACPKCGGTGEADSGGVMPWGAPAMILCECQQPAAVDGATVSAKEIAALRTVFPDATTNDLIDGILAVKSEALTAALSDHDQEGKDG